MVNGFNVLNESFWTNLPPEILARFESLITILKVTGIVVIGYIIFLIVKWVLGVKRHERINKIYKKVNVIDKKLDIVLGKKKIEELEKAEVKKTKIEKTEKIKAKSFLKRLFWKSKKK